MKVQYIRPKGYENLRAWCTDESNEYIGRRGVVFIDKKRYPEEDSVWANPYKIGKDGDRDEVLEKYEEYIWGKMGEEPEKYDIESLKGKRLGCWCHPEKCHGDVLKKILGMIVGPDTSKPVFQVFEKEKELVENKSCPFCEEKIVMSDFESEIAKEEYTISGMCQKCQTEQFGTKPMGAKPKPMGAEPKPQRAKPKVVQRKPGLGGIDWGSESSSDEDS